jgi:hypothetical protein
MGGDEIGGAAGAETSGIGAPAAPGRPLRMTAGRKREAVLRLLRGEPLEIVARELGVTAAGLSGWRDAFLEAGAASLKTRERDDRDATIDRLRTKVGELTMDAALLQAKRAARVRGRWRPFWLAEVEAMSAVISISAGRRYGVARVCRAWGVSRRASIAAGRHHRRWPPGAGRGRRGRCPMRPWSRRSGRRSRAAPFTARATARSGRGCATPGCGRRRSVCAA